MSEPTDRSWVEPATSEADPVIDAYKKDVDRTLLRANLARTVEERIRNLGRLQRFADELRRAGRALRCHSQVVKVSGSEYRCLGLARLIHVKRAAGRPKDLEAVAELEALQEERRDQK